MIIQKNDNFRNNANISLRPTKQEGQYIRYQLNRSSFCLAKIGAGLVVGKDTVSKVVCGRRRSRRVEAEIARVLGKASWNEVVAEARLAVSGNYAPSAKDVSRLLEQTYQQYQKRLVELEEHHKQMAKKLEPTRAAIAARKWKR